MLSYGPRLRTSQGPLPPSWVGSSAPEPPSLARPCRGCPHTAHPFRVHGAHLINRRLVPVKLGNWHQMQFVLSVWGGLNSCLSFFFSLEAETLKIVIGNTNDANTVDSDKPMWVAASDTNFQETLSKNNL